MCHWQDVVMIVVKGGETSLEVPCANDSPPRRICSAGSSTMALGLLGEQFRARVML